MTEFIQPTSLITENGEIIGEQEYPVIQVKKLNGQGSLYKLTDANFESINAQSESNGTINVDRFIRSVRSHFGPGHHTISALTNIPFPNEFRSLGMMCVEAHSKVSVTKTQYHFDEVQKCDIFIFDEGWGVSMVSLDSWYGFAKKAHEDEEVGDDFMELCDTIMEQAPNLVSHLFDDTMFDKHLDSYYKLTAVRERVYD